MHGSTDWDSCCQCGKSAKGSQASEEGRWRIILDADGKTAPSITLFNNLNCLPFTKQSLIKRLTLVYNRLDNNFNTPIYIDNLLIKNSDIHQRETRYSDLICFVLSTQGKPREGEPSGLGQLQRGTLLIHEASERNY